MQSATCPDREQLSAFLWGQMALAEQESIAQHLEGCTQCESSAQMLEAAPDSLGSQLLEEIHDRDSFENEPQLQRVLTSMQQEASTLRRDHETATLHETGIPQKIGVYSIVEKLGSGGMGAVYKAIHTELDKTVALKVLSAACASDSARVARFRREMKAVGRLSHPNLVQAHDAGEADNMQYLVMEFIDGLDVHQIVRRVGPLSLAQACEIVRQAAVGVASAHQHGVIHRDLKPSNLILAPDGTVKVLDMGLARFINQPVTDELTGAGLLMGTIDYMAPEQAGSGPPISQRTDVYGLGATLFRLLTGRVPFSDPSLDSTLKKVVARSQSDAPAVQSLRADVPSELSDLVGSMLARDPHQRPEASEIADRLKKFCAESDLPELVNRAIATKSDPSGLDPTVFSTARGAVGDTDLRSTSAPMKRSRPWLWFGIATIAVFAAVILTFNGTRPDSSDTTGTTTITDGASNDANISNLDQSKSDSTQSTQSSNDSEPDGDADVDPAGVAADSGNRVAATAEVAQESNDDKPRVVPIAILPFKDRSEGLKLGDKLADVVYSQLATQTSFYLVEREELSSVLKEQELNLSGAVKLSEAIQLGQITGAKLFVTGSVSQIDKTIFIVAKIISMETTRTVGTTVQGSTADDLAPLALKLAKQVEEQIKKDAQRLTPPPASRKDRLAELKKELGNAKRPKLWIRVREEHVGQRTIDPAVQTELILIARAAGFTVIDEQEGSPKQADILVEGEAFSELAGRRGNLASVKARAEVKAVDRSSSQTIAVDRETTIRVDLAEQTAGKTALQNAGEEIAFRLLPKLVNRER